MSESVFKIIFDCGNCGNEWKEEYPAGARVVESHTSAPSIKCENHGFRHSSTNCNICVINIECPVCEISDDISINRRSPL